MVNKPPAAEVEELRQALRKIGELEERVLERAGGTEA